MRSMHALSTLTSSPTQTAPRKAPLDLPIPDSSSQPASTAAVSQPSPSAAAQEGGTGGGSKVEAARRFLEQVGMSDPAPPPTSAASAAKAKFTAPALAPAAKGEALPDRFPGESGGMLREVSTRRLAPSGGAPEQSAPDQKAASANAVPDTVTAAQPSNGATRTASALSFGSAPSARSTVGVYAAPRTSARLSAYELDRQWREATRSGGVDEATRRQREWKFLRVSRYSIRCSMCASHLAATDTHFTSRAKISPCYQRFSVPFWNLIYLLLYSLPSVRFWLLRLMRSRPPRYDDALRRPSVRCPAVLGLALRWLSWIARS